MDATEEKILWKSAEQNLNQARSILISDIVDIFAGINATMVMKKNKVPMELNHMCFSLITKKR